ncbi:MAG: endonuclease [Saprospiraceae bacterium]|nr:endonuclease [Saprospiraceae bacterium]
MTRFFLFCLLSFFLFGCSNSKKAATIRELDNIGNCRLAFYNVENLFDIVDDPTNTGDNEYLPTSKKAWTPERYQVKLDHLAKVVEGMGYPTLIGMAEVENANVLKDFCEKTSLKQHNYGFVHFESPDFRGIDVALVYKKSQFNMLDAKPIKVEFPVGMIPDKPDYTTRDLLLVKGEFGNGATVQVMVAHLPSRSDGEKETEPRRMHVASLIKKQVESIAKKDGSASFILMGDMNDEPSNNSMSQSLGALPIGNLTAANKLYNCFSKFQQDGLGSYRYRGDWNMLDQIILSGNLVQGKNNLNYVDANIFQAPWMMYNDEKYGISPSRTYGGDRYFGGYSDHLPIYVDLKW